MAKVAAMKSNPNPYAGNISDLPDDTQVKVEALFRPARDAFEKCLQGLGIFPDPKISLLADLTWKIVGAKICPTVIPTDMGMMKFLSRFSGVNFSLLGDKTKEPIEAWPVLFVHPGLHDLVRKSLSMQLGSIVVAGSHAVDAWMGKFPPMSRADHERAAEEARIRSQIYEAQFLIGLKKVEVSFEPTRWQRNVLAKWPAGWQTEGASAHWSEPKTWET